MANRTPWIVATVVVGCVSAGASAEITLGTELVVGGLTRPLFVTAAPGDHGRLFILEQFVNGRGRIRIFDRNTQTLLVEPFLSIPVSQSGEQGLLGLAFHPDYANNGRFFVNHTAPHTFIAEYRVSNDPNVADADSRVQLLMIAQPYSNHNGGWIGFGPDGFLYVASGDGGASYDPDNHAQNPNSLLGKILRIDVDRDDFPEDPLRNYGIPPDNPYVDLDGADEVWALGLRNPWRCSFDRLTGDLWIGDVGQSTMEEVNRIAAETLGGVNFGWRCMEGTLCTSRPGCACGAAEWTPPIFEYTHASGGGCSITGGYVYRGCAIPALHGHYFLADFCSARITTFLPVNGVATDVRDRTAELAPTPLNIFFISSFGEDAAGELYICDLFDGEVFRLIDRSARDCDNDGRPDLCETAPPLGSGDANCDGVVNNLDINAFVVALIGGRSDWEQRYSCNYLCSNDMNADGAVNNFDIDPFVVCVVMGGCP